MESSFASGWVMACHPPAVLRNLREKIEPSGITPGAADQIRRGVFRLLSPPGGECNLASDVKEAAVLAIRPANTSVGKSSVVTEG